MKAEVLSILFAVIPPASRMALLLYSRGLRNNCEKKGKREGSAFRARKPGTYLLPHQLPKAPSGSVLGTKDTKKVRILINSKMLCRLENIFIAIVLKLTRGRLSKVWKMASHCILAIVYSGSF